ncbi:hypothetical protein GCM10019059_24110 [Camelimonas fluminis]|uniref:Uncharacterized protein n=1 Tax=Camelimonas fluminis TaxID=1576911 RepID=A0ABV7UBU9_9HYPH|nr:hypothetical protein [Camelimonas fluminis]GHE63792.1 hypothetical protein GCM10019059_24110 [Camelimonas fluminis]
MRRDHTYLVVCILISAAGGVALGIVVDDWRFTVFATFIFAAPLGMTAIQGARIIRMNAVLPRRRRNGGRS